MKFDIESLFQQELSDAELESVYGGDGLGGGIGGPLGAGGPLGGPLGGIAGPLGGPVLGGLGFGAASSLSAASSTRVHSFSFACDVNVFSNNVLSGVAKGLLNIANCNTQICANNN